MRERTYSSEGVVLARRNYGEADRILVVYSKHFGKLHLLAKGVRKPKSKKRGHIEVFSYIKFSAVRGKGLDLVTEVETIDSFRKVRSDLKRVALAYFLLEVIGRVTKEEQKNQELFNLLTDYLDKLRSPTSLREIKNSFIYNCLVLLGFWPKGRLMENPDKILEEIVEKRISSARVGKKILS